MSGTPLFMTNYKSIKANIYYISEFLHNFLKFLRSCLEQRNASEEIEKIGRNRVCVFCKIRNWKTLLNLNSNI